MTAPQNMAALPLAEALEEKKGKTNQKFILNSSMRDLRHNKSHVMVNLTFSTYLAQAILDLMVVKPTEQTKPIPETFFGWFFF